MALLWDSITMETYSEQSYLDSLEEVEIESSVIQITIDKHEVLCEGKIVRVECQYEYSRLAIYKEFNGKRAKIKIQPSSRNLDKIYTVASFCGYDIVVAIHETI